MMPGREPSGEDSGSDGNGSRARRLAERLSVTVFLVAVGACCAATSGLAGVGAGMFIAIAGFIGGLGLLTPPFAPAGDAIVRDGSRRLPAHLVGQRA